MGIINICKNIIISMFIHMPVATLYTPVHVYIDLLNYNVFIKFCDYAVEHTNVQVFSCLSHANDIVSASHMRIKQENVCVVCSTS